MAVNRIGPECPNCGHDLTSVITTARSPDGGFYRRRCCSKCEHRFVTAQLAEVPIGGHVFHWKDSRLSQISWQHPDLIWQLRCLITGKSSKQLEQTRGGKAA